MQWLALKVRFVKPLDTTSPFPKAKRTREMEGVQKFFCGTYEEARQCRDGLHIQNFSIFHFADLFPANAPSEPTFITTSVGQS